MAYRFVGKIDLGSVVLVRRRTAAAEENEISQKPTAVTTSLQAANVPFGFSEPASGSLVLPIALNDLRLMS